MDEHGERKRKSFSGTTKAEVNKKITEYIADFESQTIESDESKKTLQDSIRLAVFKHSFSFSADSENIIIVLRVIFRIRFEKKLIVIP